MSSVDTVSDSLIDWTSSDIDGDEDGGVDSGLHDVDRLVTVEDPSKVVTINTRGMLEQGVVRAMASIVEHPEYVEVVEASTSGSPLGILRDSLASVITEENLDSIRTIYGILEDVELCAPNEHERADWDIPEWTCFYEYTLRLGFRFSVPQLVRRMLVYYDLAPSQLMLNTWRILLSLGVLCERRNIKFGLGCLLHNYYLKEHVGDQGRYILIPRDKKNALIIDTTTIDRNWKDTFFFAKGPPVDDPWGEQQHQYR
ncbi:hypothetical protein LWI29_023847 [Acer saccharum]|uniref:Uncharacterized protein n=1 Tax=Acer saccharum TaxID=4024 RepID=A0AA39V972_ACESA|nr:hypothetical protein LWI29_023847 [Acer saccharum]